MSDQKNSSGSTNATSSPASEDGPSHWRSQAWIVRLGSGREVAPASLSARQAKEKDWRMIAMSGPPSDGSSLSAVLQSSLESRLRALMEGRGSPEYKLTWKSWDMGRPLPICALRASVPRTSGNAFTGWQSPTVNDSKGSDYSYGQGDHSKVCLKLPGAAKVAAGLPVAGYPTPRAADASKGRDHTANTSERGTDLPTVAGWATPAAQEPGGSAQQFLERKRKARENGSSLGISLTALSLQVQTGSTGALNPDLSRWLMGYPDVWGSCAAMATQLSRK